MISRTGRIRIAVRIDQQLPNNVVVRSSLTCCRVVWLFGIKRLGSSDWSRNAELSGYVAVVYESTIIAFMV